MKHYFSYTAQYYKDHHIQKDQNGVVRNKDTNTSDVRHQAMEGGTNGINKTCWKVRRASC